MSELRLYLRRDGLRECAWALRGDDGRVAAAGTGLDGLPPARHCRLVLAADLVGMVPASLPELPPARLHALLPAAAEAHCLAEAEQLHVVRLGRDAAGSSWLAVVDKAWLGTVLEGLKGHGPAPDAALPEPLLLPLGAGAWTLLRHEDGAALRLGEHQAHALDRGEPPAGLRLALAGARPERLDVYGGTALADLDAERWQAELGLPVRDRGAWSWREAAWPEGPDLLQGAFKPRHSRLDWPVLARSLAWGLALLAAIQLAGTAADWARLAREQARLQTGMRQLAERVLPAHAAIADPAWQVTERLKAAQAARGGAADGFPALLGRIGAAWPAGLAAAAQVEYRDGTVTLGFGPDAPAAGLAGLKAGLEQAGLQVKAGAGTLTVRAAAPVQGERHGR